MIIELAIIALSVFADANGGSGDNRRHLKLGKIQTALMGSIAQVLTPGVS